jgi:hypothetical protein
VGQTATFSVAATGSPALTYQWRKNGTAIAGATAATYTTPVLSAADGGASYTVVVTNPVNAVTSAAAVLTVNPAVPPTIAQQPASVSVRANDPVSFSVTVAGTSPFTYQWQFNSANIIGANATTYTLPQVQNGDAGNYTVIVSNAAGSVTSAAATLTIAPPGTNLALHQPATASTIQGGGLEAANATDGVLTTRWASAGGIDPSWLQVDLGAVKAFNTVVLYWEAAFAAQYQIQYSNDGQAWNVAAGNTSGHGGVETVIFPTVQGRFVRMFGQVRASAFGYSLFELQVYNVAQCGGAGERFTVLSSTLVKDNQSGLTWQRAQTTDPNQGAQFTQPIAQSYCASQSMRLPTQAEALTMAYHPAASRRAILGGAGALFAWNFMPRIAYAAGGGDPRFVVIILRGALDGLTAVPPIGDPSYKELRQSIALTMDGPHPALKLDGFFALDPSMPNFGRLYHANQAAIVHACATAYRDRSHFDGQDVLESGYPSPGHVESGWLNRLLLTLPKGDKVAPGAATGSSGLAVGANTPLVIRGRAPVLGWAPATLKPADAELPQRLMDLYTHTDPLFARLLTEGIATGKIASGMDVKARGGAGDRRYRLGRARFRRRRLPPRPLSSRADTADRG